MTPNKWSEPSTLLGILGFAAMVWGGYTTFQRDTAGEMRKLGERIAALEAQVSMLERDHDRRN